MARNIGLVFEGRWKVVEYIKYGEMSGGDKYILENIFNGEIMNINDKTLRRIKCGETSVSRLRKKKLKNNRFKF